MNHFNGDPLLTNVKCKMCPSVVGNFAAGICERCMGFWSCTNNLEKFITVDLVKTAVVIAARYETNHTIMDETFRKVIEQEQQKQKWKLELFHKWRGDFQQSVLPKDFHDDDGKIFEVEEDFCEKPLANDEVYQHFRKQFRMTDVMDLPPQFLRGHIPLVDEYTNKEIN